MDFEAGKSIGGLHSQKTQSVSRRSFVGLITGAAAATVVATPVMAQRSGVTDSDTGGGADPSGNSRGEGVTDSDTGSNRDCGGPGRGSCAS